MKPLRLAAVGVGHLGKEHARILASLPDVELVGVVDVHPGQAAEVARRCGTQPFTDYRELLPRVDAAIIAVPTSHHHAVARDFLSRGISLLIEKPITRTVAEADELVDLARRHGAVLQVGHIERFNPAFETFQGRPFRPCSVTAERLGGFSGRSTDIGVVLDLMIHDIDLVRALVPGPVRSVRAVGVSVLGGHEDLAQAELAFADGCVVHLSASRVHAAPSRRMSLWGPEGFATLDLGRRHLTLTQPSAELRRPGFDVRRLDPASLASVRSDLFGRYLEVHEIDCSGGDQLTREIESFLDCLRSGRTPRVDGHAGRDALMLAEQILASIADHRWTADPHGPQGPHTLPDPRGLLFTSPRRDRDQAA